MRRLVVFLTVLMMAVIPVPMSFAVQETSDDAMQETVQEASAKAGVITAFQPLEEPSVWFAGTPSEEELMARLPETLSVFLDGSETPEQIPVSWEVVEGYGNTSFYIYSARPVWPDECTLAADLDPDADVPWITLFRQDSVGGDMSLNAKGSTKASTKEEKVYRYLTEDMGLNMAAACGVMTNLYAESGMQPNNLENTYNRKYGLSDEEYTDRVDRGKKNSSKGKYTDGNGKTRYFTTDYSGYGICQWTTSGRRTKVISAAIKKDVSIANLNMQLGVLRDELENDYPQVWATLQNVPDNATGVYLAAAHFCVSFEVPANTYNTAASRAKTALSSYWKAYSGKSPSATGKSYMGICGYSYPKSIKKGTGMTVSGYVISNYKITSISAKIVNDDGDAVYSRTKNPGASFHSLNTFDRDLMFSKLPKGDYTYQITVKDSYGKEIRVKHKFSVGSTHKILRGCATKDVSAKDDDPEPTTAAPTDPGADPAAPASSNLRGEGITYPTTLKKGSGFTIKGKVKSDCTLEKVTITIKTAEGVKKQSAAARPAGVKTYNLKKLDAKIRFGKLAKGDYYYIVKAADTSQTKTLLKKKFTVR